MKARFLIQKQINLLTAEIVNVIVNDSHTLGKRKHALMSAIPKRMITYGWLIRVL